MMTDRNHASVRFQSGYLAHRNAACISLDRTVEYLVRTDTVKFLMVRGNRLRRLALTKQDYELILCVLCDNTEYMSGRHQYRRYSQECQDGHSQEFHVSSRITLLVARLARQSLQHPFNNGEDCRTKRLGN